MEIINFIFRIDWFRALLFSVTHFPWTFSRLCYIIQVPALYVFLKSLSHLLNDRPVARL